MTRLREEVELELNSISAWWRTHAVDHVRGGFWGEINEMNIPNHAADKGSILTSRILWTFSATYAHTLKRSDLDMAHRGFEYLLQKMIDPVHGGLYWSVNANGEPVDTHKQIYAQAFGIYALSEYVKITNNPEALQAAKQLFYLIERFGYDVQYSGYLEAFESDWTARVDQRLSAKEINVPKTMNTHLHLLEAYANLYEVWPEKELQEKGGELLDLFKEKFIDCNTYHLRQFFDRSWTNLPGMISYGHDLEAAWLLGECSHKLAKDSLVKPTQDLSIQMINAGLEGLDKDGGLWYEFEPATKKTIMQKHWWPQAEAMIALQYAYDLTNKDQYRVQRDRNWSFIYRYLRDADREEWYWGVDEKYQLMKGYYKAGFWKGPYHNSRCCLELLKRLRNTGNE